MLNLGEIMHTFYEQNILSYIQSLQQYPIKLVSLIIDIAIVLFLTFGSVIVSILESEPDASDGIPK